MARAMGREGRTPPFQERPRKGREVVGAPEGGEWGRVGAAPPALAARLMKPAKGVRAVAMLRTLWTTELIWGGARIDRLRPRRIREVTHMPLGAPLQSSPHNRITLTAAEIESEQPSVSFGITCPNEHLRRGREQLFCRLTTGLARKATPSRADLVWCWSNHFTTSSKLLSGQS